MFMFMPPELASAALAFIPIKAIHYWYKKVTLHIKRLIELQKKGNNKLGPVLLTGAGENRVKRHSIHLCDTHLLALLEKRIAIKLSEISKFFGSA